MLNLSEISNVHHLKLKQDITNIDRDRKEINNLAINQIDKQ